MAKPNAIAKSPGERVFSFDDTPIAAFEGIKLRARSVLFTGRVTQDNWRAALEFTAATGTASPYWVGDLLTYAETRAEWQDMAAQVTSSLGLSLHTIKNQHYIATHVDVEARALAPSFSHSGEVASLPPGEQRAWLTKATDEGYTTNELRRQIRAAARRGVIEGQAVLEGQFRVLYAAPPWKTMPVAEMCKLPVAAHTTPDAVLFLWVPPSLILQNPGPREVLEAWDFTARTNIVWDKVRGLGGHYTYVRHEHLVIATRGKFVADYRGGSTGEHGEGMVQSVHAERVRDPRIAEKPETFRKAIERMYAGGPYLELFGRAPTEGWTTFGSDARRWHKDATQ